MFDWLFIKSYQYIVLINYDKSFELTKKMLDAICSYPTINFKPRNYHFITKVYYGMKTVSAKSISKIDFGSMENVSVGYSCNNANPQVTIGNGQNKIFNYVYVRFVDSELSKFLLYLKDYFFADYGFVCKWKDDGSLSDALHQGSKTWFTDDRKVCEGFLKDVYPVNILNSAHVQNALIDKIKEDERMGNIDSSVDGYIIWNVAPSNIRYARRVCKKMGLLI